MDPPSDLPSIQRHLSKFMQPTKYSRTWSQQLVQQLFEQTAHYCAQHGKLMDTLVLEDFERIAWEVRRSPVQCMKKVREVLISGTYRPGVWCKAEDELLESLLQANLGWKQVAKHINSVIYGGLKVRNSKHCRERWSNHLNPTIKRGQWTPDEDCQLLEAFARHGKRWNCIALEIRYRTALAVKNRFNSLLRRETKVHGPASAELQVRRLLKRLQTRFDPAILYTAGTCN